MALSRRDMLVRRRKKIEQLEAANTLLDELLETSVESYRLSTGEGGAQWATRRKIKEVRELIESLEKQIEALERKLTRTNLVEFDLRRRS
jgi:septation ring formation regulator EzrA